MFSSHLPLRLLRSLSQKLQRSLSFKSETFIPRNQTSALHPNLKSINSEISSCMRNGLIRDAEKLFDGMPLRNTVTWNTMIRGYFKSGEHGKAMNVFNQMKERDIFSYNTVIAGLMNVGDVGGAEEVFDGMLVRDVVTWNSMIGGYVRNGMIEKAIELFNLMPVRDVVSWNLVISGFVNCGTLDLAEEYFRQMSDRDVVSWTTMISGLSKAGRIGEAQEFFEKMPVKDAQAWNVMIAGYIENGYLDKAEALFRKIPEPGFSSWKLMIDGLLDGGHVNDALKYFTEMPQKCQKTWNLIHLGLIRNGLVEQAHASLEKSPYSDVVSWTNLIAGYFQKGMVENAVKAFDVVQTRDVTMWNVIIFGLGENDRGEEGLKLFIRLKEETGSSPDEATLTSVLTICSELPMLQLGQQIQAQAIQTGLNLFTSVSNAMITMYARSGIMQSALMEFSSMANCDVISWNSVICGFAHHGNAVKALDMFERMRKTDVKPNSITFVGLLSACSHAGLVEEGKHYFDYMKNVCLLNPTVEHYTCIVDLLGKNGLFEEAMEFLTDMRETGTEVPASVWGALLGACRIHRNIELGEFAGQRVLEMELENSGVYSILAEMYLGCGRREDAERIWARMRDNRVKKQPGCSWIEMNNSFHVFLSGDCANPEFTKICWVLELLRSKMDRKSLKCDEVLLEFQV